MNKRVGVIGAGPAGIMASIVAARSGWMVLLFDSNPGVGRKLLVTGGGRCNITNAKIHENVYHTSDKSFVRTALHDFGHRDLVNYLEQLCIPLYATDDGWFYPISNSASNVVDILDAVLDQFGVRKILNTKVTRILREPKGFRLFGSEKEFFVDRLIVASGGKAYPSLGSSGELLDNLSGLGHHILPVLPALAPIRTDMSAIHSLQGVRLDVTTSLVKKGSVLGEATGNMIFTSWGVNGPAVMDISHLVNLNQSDGMLLKINFLSRQEELLRKMISRYRTGGFPVKALLESVLPQKICVYSLERSKIAENEMIGNLSENQLNQLLENLKNVSVKVKGTRDFQFSQVSTGGVDVRQVNPATMESQIVRGLYLAGEVLDVVGPCGGYNLQWAFSSGAIAGRLLP